MALTKVSGDFIDAGSITQGHLHSSHGITTTHIAEGDKLFFTNARVDSRIGSLSSSDLSEGTNLYYTDARARAAISGTGSLSYNSTTGVMSFTMPAQNTSNITEGSNLYYTDARADARVALIVDSAPSTLDTLNELAAALGDDANFSTTITNSIGTKWTQDNAKITNWDTAYSWGDHGLSAQDKTDISNLSGTNTGDQTLASLGYTGATNANYITNNNQLTNGAGYLTSFTETNSFLGDGGNASTHPGTSRVIYSGQVSQGTGALGMPTINNANSFLNLNKHNGEYNSQLGFSSNGHIYYRNFNNTAINGTQTWHKVYTENVFANNSANWNTAYGWGNHASAGYAPAGGSYGTDWYANALYHDEWVRNHTNNSGHYWSSTGWHLYPKTSEFFFIRSGLSSSTGLAFTCANETVVGYVYADSGSNIGLLNNAGQWSLQSDNSKNVTAHGSSRAPIFYDSNDTAYYVDPASNSRLNTLDFTHSGYYIKRGDWGPRIQSPSGWIQFGPANTSHAHIYTDRSNFYFNAMIQVNGGSQMNTNDIRAQIFYDLNDTGFYLNPASQSRLGSLKLDGIISGTASGCAEYGRNHAYHTPEIKGYGAEFMIGAQHTEININYRTCNNGASGHTPTTWKWRAGSASNWSDHYMGLIQSSSSMRAPIFYDSNDTTYYIDPAATSSIVNLAIKGDIRFPTSSGATHARGTQSYAIYQESGSWGHPFPDLNIGFHTGISIGAYGGYGGTRFFNNSDMATQIMSVGNSSDGLGSGNVYINDKLQVGTDVRAPIFYDVNDTNYYVNPGLTSSNSTSHSARFRQSVQIGDSSVYNQNDGGWGARLIVSDDVHARIDVAQDANSMRSSWYSHTGHAGSYFGTVTGHHQYLVSHNANRQILYSGYSEEQGSYRAPIFYDSNDTTYYTNPASTSNLKLIQTGGNHQANTPRWDTAFYVAQSQHYYAHSSTQTMYIGESNTINIRSIGIASGSLRAPIFYDSNDTSYYIDPNSSSNIVNLTVANTISGSITRTAGTSGYGHPGTGMWAFYNWGGSNGGGSAPTSSSYTTGISIGSHPGDQAYGWQMANNMWNAGVWYRTYNSGFSSWYKFLDNTTNTQTINASAYVNGDLGIGFNSGSIGGKLNIRRTTAGISIKNDLGGSLSGSTIGLHQYTSASMNSGGYHMVFQATPTSGSDTNMLLCNINGNLRNRNNSYGQYSDRNIKENITDATPKLEDVKKLQVRNFNFIGDDLKQIGLIAQETELVFPGLVENDLNPQGDMIKSLKYSVLVPILVKAMQEQQTIIDDLKSRLETLENQ